MNGPPTAAIVLTGWTITGTISDDVTVTTEDGEVTIMQDSDMVLLDPSVARALAEVLYAAADQARLPDRPHRPGGAMNTDAIADAIDDVVTAAEEVRQYAERPEVRALSPAALDAMTAALDRLDALTTPENP